MSADLTGSTFGGFRLLRALGTGGMSTVYAAENELNPRIRRAVKVIHAQLASEPAFLARFTAEAEVLERLAHPNVLRFYGIRREQGQVFLELELLDGESLEAAAARPNPPDVVFGWIAQAAAGLAAAHALGVVHRDVKPDNLFLDRAGVVKVLDFGIAHAAGAVRHTTQGMVAGTAGYLAPEVCRGGEPTPAADVYALGLCAYELLLGRHPLIPPGSSMTVSSVQLLLAHVEATLPEVEGLAPPLAELLGAMTARDPARRIPDAGALVAALADVGVSAAPRVPVAPARTFETARTVDAHASGIGPGGVGAGGVGAGGRPTPPAGGPRFQTLPDVGDPRDKTRVHALPEFPTATGGEGRSPGDGARDAAGEPRGGSGAATGSTDAGTVGAGTVGAGTGGAGGGTGDARRGGTGAGATGQGPGRKLAGVAAAALLVAGVGVGGGLWYDGRFARDLDEACRVVAEATNDGQASAEQRFTAVRRGWTDRLGSAEVKAELERIVDLPVGERAGAVEAYAASVDVAPFVCPELEELWPPAPPAPDTPAEPSAAVQSYARAAVAAMAAQEGGDEGAKTLSRLERLLAEPPSGDKAIPVASGGGLTAKPAPPLNVTWFSSSVVYGADRPTVLYLWDLGCTFCERYAPAFASTAARHRDRADFALLSCNEDRTWLPGRQSVANAKAWLRENGVTLPAGKEKGCAFSTALEVTGIPVVVAVKNGSVVWQGHPSTFTDEVLGGL